ncbi:MAG: BlaI/MecI/CopY family transcriptional regulator [bacterium]|nr:BlaI/MecI/CopY family transcriptional regulator [bacterium]
MAQKRDMKLTPLEAIIMDCVWGLSQATVRQVQDRLKPTRPMAYNTVLTMMGILREKGFLRSRREGRADVYHPSVTRKQVGRSSLRELRDRFFAGSARGLVSELLDSERWSAEEIRAIRREVDRKLREKDGRASGA